MTATASPFAKLSTDALKALAWLRDNRHTRAGWMVAERRGKAISYMQVRNQDRATWTHFRIEGGCRRLTLAASVMEEIGPYIAPAVQEDRMWVPNMVGLQVLLRAGLCR
jgi:hypothetical protein